METLWFFLAAATLAIYVAADGYDFGAGTLHLLVARTDDERRAVLAAIGPVWDGNEVWLLVTGSVLFLAFPGVLAAGLSGFYLPIMMVTWTLILRGLAIEFRSHHESAVWRAFWDGVFALASTAMPVLLGVALGNVLRGVPIDGTGYFHISLFTSLTPAPPLGALDWYTVLVGAFALVALTAHGALFLTWKTTGAVRERAQALSPRLWAAVVVLLPAVTWATARVNADLFANFPRRPAAWALALAWTLGLAGVFAFVRRGRAPSAFVASSIFLVALLAATAASVYPVMLRSVLAPGFHLTAQSAASGPASLRAGLWWWGMGIPLALIYAVMLLRLRPATTPTSPTRQD